MNPDKPAKTPPTSRLPAPVDHEVRPTRRPTPNVNRRIDEMIDELEAYDWGKLRRRMKALDMVDRTGSTFPDGHKTRTLSADIPANDPESLTPTEAAANARSFAGTGTKKEGDKTGTWERDPVHEANMHALSALSQAATAMGSLIDHLRRGEDIRKPDKESTNAAKCEEPTCQDDAAKGERGRCHACYCWLNEHRSDQGEWPAAVPADLIEARRKRRHKAA